MLLLKTVVVLGMLLGLVLTFSPTWPGIPLIFFAGMVYGVFTDFTVLTIPRVGILAGLTVAGYWGAAWLRRSVTRNLRLSRRFGLDVLGGGTGGFVVSDVLFGPILGFIIWQLLLGRSLPSLPKVAGRLFLPLVLVGCFRFVCALTMIAIIIQAF